jgi:hypothetical protein
MDSAIGRQLMETLGSGHPLAEQDQIERRRD